MARLGRTIGDLARYRKAMAAMAQAQAPAGGRLAEVAGLSANPGNLRMLAYVPETLAPRPALVVVLHGCTQTAEGYDLGTGWSTLADRHGFALLYPEQRRANNPNACFSWFEPGDTARGAGEAASIRAMIARMVEDHGIDESRIYVTGLSAGGAMTAAMLAAYPEVFAAGAVVAGLPYGTAAGVQEAFESMFTGRAREAGDWGDRVRAASSHGGPWPRVSVWHGDADTTVVPGNGDEVVKQWIDVHGIALRSGRATREGAATRRVWRDAAGTVMVEQMTIPGLAHGTPLATSGEEACGQAGPYLLEAGISSTHHIARFFGLLDEAPLARPAARLPAPLGEPVAARAAPRARPGAAEPRAAHAKAASPKAARPEAAQPKPAQPKPAHAKVGHPGGIDVEAVITNALRAAGLMRH